MMKKLLLGTAIFSAVLSTNVSASMKSADKFKFIGDTEYAGLCQAAATDDLSLFKSNVKHHGMRLGASHKKMLRLIASDQHFKCAGQGLVNFANQRGSADIANYIMGDEAATASTSKYKFVGDRNFKNFCKAAVTDDVSLFKQAVTRHIGSLGLSKKEVIDKVLDADNVTCSGEGLTEFFKQREANSVLNYIAESLANK